MSTFRDCRTAAGALLCAAAVLFALVAAPGAALAANGINPVLGAVDANAVRTNATGDNTWTPDPEADVFGCTFPVGTLNNYGFDYGDTYMWYDAGTDELYVVVETYGHVGDADGDGGYDSKTGGCNGYDECVVTEGDIYDNVFAVNTEIIRFYFDRNCDGDADLTFDLTGTQGNGDRVFVSLDEFSAMGGTDLGAQGAAWQALNTGGAALQAGPDPAGACIAQRAGAILVRIPSWSSYFMTDAANLSACRFNWFVDSGNNSDQFIEDLVAGVVDLCSPSIDVTKEFDKALICAQGDTLFAAITVTNDGNTWLSQVSIEDQLQAGLTYGGEIIDDPTLPLGAPTISGGGSVISWSGLEMAPGESRSFSIRLFSQECVEGSGNTVYVDGIFASDCAPGGVGAQVSDNASDDVLCDIAMVDLLPPDPQTLCAGSDYTVTFTVQNTHPTRAANIYVDDCPGGPFLNVEPGGTRQFDVAGTLPDVCGDPVEVSCSVTAYLVELPGVCGASDSEATTISCLPPEVEIVKSTAPEVTEVGTTVTIEVCNPGDSDLNPVRVTDTLPPGLGFDETQTVMGSCGVTVDAVSTLPDGSTLIEFTDFTLAAGECCIIEYTIDCLENDNEARVDTAWVYAWCDGSYPDAEPVAVSDTAQVVCQAGEACPHTIGFWRQQCAQKGNGSTKICRVGMEELWRCVIDATDVVEWQIDEDEASSETTADLRLLSDEQLFIHLCDQLQGPRPMTLRDMAEIQYLGLMLNFCIEGVVGDLPLDGVDAMNIAAAIDSIENAINTGWRLDYWKDVADDINNFLIIPVPYCEDGQDRYTNYPACDLDPESDLGDAPVIVPGGDPTILAAQAYPNPALLGSGMNIMFNVPAAVSNGHVELSIFDVAGRLVRTLVSESMNAGVHSATWDLRDESGKTVPAGMFFYRLQAGTDVQTKKLMVVHR